VVGVGGVHHHIPHPGPLIDVEDVLPRVSSIGGPVDPTHIAIGPRRTHHTDVDQVGIRRVSDDTVDSLRAFEAHELPTVPAVDRLVQTVPDPRRVPRVTLSGPHPNDPGIRLENRDVADTQDPLVVEDGIPRDAPIL